MTGQESTEEKIRKLEQEILGLREAIREAARHEEDLVTRLQEYENAFYNEINARVKVYKKTWTWRIGRLFVGPADWLTNMFTPKKKAASDKNTVLRNIQGKKSGKVDSLEVNAVDDFVNQATDPSKENIAVIFDTFTHSCFSPEFNTIRFSPGSWKKVLGAFPVKGLIIESAWSGNGGSWSELIANLPEKGGAQLVSLIRWAKHNNIPAVFWNKEDPVHFDQFIEAAKLCDYIFTTDAGCIEAYRKSAPAAVINALPFAAQPKIHNPLSDYGRTKPVCFAGTYYGHRYHERKNDMDFLLKPALEYGLDIYDRNFGDTSKYAENLRFPEIYKDAIRGMLEYREMLKAYKRYKVFLNVNSVRYSPTMFARRVFELLACGTPVISNYSRGIIELLGEDTVFISESETDTRKHLEYLLNDDLYWWKASLNGMRKVMAHHTYEERTKYIFDIIGLKTKEAESLKFSLVSRVSAMDEVLYLARVVHRQKYKEFDVFLIIDGEQPDFIHNDGLKALFEPYTVKKENFKDDNLANKILEGSDSTHLVYLNAGKYYGPDYLGDYAIALKYSDAAISGKKSFYRLAENNMLTAMNQGYEFRYVDQVTHATSVHRKSDMDVLKIMDFTREGYIQDPGFRILSIDPFNYLDSDAPLNEEIFENPLLNKIDL